MAKANESLLYGVADLLQVPLHPVGDGYKSNETRKTKLGPWDYEMNIQVKSDVLTEDVASFWVRLIGDLWMYVVSQRSTTKGSPTVRFIPFSASAAKLNKGMLATSCTGGVLKESLAKVKAAGGVPYQYTPKGGWEATTFDV